MSSPDGPPPAGTPAAALLIAFVERTFVCHHCGAGGPERRETDRAEATVRYRYMGEALLLASCHRCRLDDDGHRLAAAELARAVDADELAWVDRAPLAAFRCSRARCARTWCHLGGPLPLHAVREHRRGPHDLPRHPCPWCVDEDSAGAVVDHRRLARIASDLARWEEELRRAP